MIRTPDVISLEMMDVNYWTYREALQYMVAPHVVTYDGLMRRISEQRRNLVELEQALAKVKEAHNGPSAA